MKNFGGELAQQLIEKIASPEVRQLLDDTKAANDSDTGTFEVVITTENLDRYQEVIKLDGWELEHYRNNPIVLWGHDHNQPIGVATSVEIIDGKMVARGKFAPNAKGQEVRGLYDLGIIRATSVGFIEKEREGNLITKAELLEFSFVSVPANPYALSLAMEKGLSIDGLVTKGFMTVEKDAQEPENEPETPEEAEAEETPADEGEQAPEEPVAPQELTFSGEEVSQILDSLKSVVLALEALGTKSEEPEGDDAGDPEEAPEETTEERELREFNEARRILQFVSTAVSETLADMRTSLRERGL